MERPSFRPVTLPARGATAGDFAESIRQNRERLNRLASSPVACHPPLISLEGQGVVWRNTINIVQGKFGSHKSRIAETLCSLLPVGEPEQPA